MKNILFFLSLIIGFSVVAQKAIYTDNDGDGVIEYTLMGDNGNILETGFYYNQKMVGTWTSYFPDGKKQTIAKFKNGLRHGNWVIFNKEGLIVFQVLYKDGKKISASQHSYASNK